MELTRDEIRSFLERYGAAQAESAEATAGLWTMPAMLVDLYDDPMVFTSHEDLVRALEPAYPIYQRLGLRRIGLLETETTDITASLVRARVRWSFEDEEASLFDTVFEYTLRCTGDHLRVCAAVAIDLAEKVASSTVDASPVRGSRMPDRRTGYAVGMDDEKRIALQAVADRVSSYQDSAPDRTVEAELRAALGETDVELEESETRTLASAIEEHGEVDVADVLG